MLLESMGICLGMVRNAVIYSQHVSSAISQWTDIFVITAFKKSTFYLLKDNYKFICF